MAKLGKKRPKKKRGPGSTSRAREEARLEKEWLSAQKETAGNDPKTGSPVKLPPLVEYVLQEWAFLTRGEMVRNLCPLYRCSAHTIDRARERAKGEAEAWARGRRETRIAYSVSFLEGLAKKATKKEKFQAARAAMVDARKLTGDVAPERVILMEELPEQAALRRAQDLARKAKEAADA